MMKTCEGRIGDTPTLAFFGELDRSELANSVRVATDFLDRHGGPLLLDTTHLSYIDSGGVATLYLLLDRLQADGQWLGVMNPSRGVLRVLHVAGLLAQPHVRVFASRDEAVQALNGKGSST